MHPIIARVQDMHARGQARPFSVGLHRSAFPAINGGGDHQYLLKLAASGMGSGLLITHLVLEASQPVHFGIEQGAADSTAGYTDVSATWLSAQGGAAGFTVHQLVTGATGTVISGFEVPSGNRSPIELPAPVFREYQGDGNDAVLIQIHNESGTGVTAGNIEFRAMGICWDMDP